MKNNKHGCEKQAYHYAPNGGGSGMGHVIVYLNTMHNERKINVHIHLYTQRIQAIIVKIPYSFSSVLQNTYY